MTFLPFLCVFLFPKMSEMLLRTAALKIGRTLKTAEIFFDKRWPHGGKPKLTCHENVSTLNSLTHTHERRRKLITRIHADLVLRACISLLRCSRASGTPKMKVLVYTGMLPCLVPFLPSDPANWYLVLISFRSRSGADYSLDLFGLGVTHLVLQACISF